jgi:hypothetical protein
LHATSLCFKGELVPNAAKRPLMDFLIVGGSKSDIAHIANPDGLDALFFFSSFFVLSRSA